VWARYRAEEVPALEAELATHTTGIRDGVFTVSDRPHRDLCATCPGRGTLCSWPEETTLRAS
jgi:ATP-dependent helicase/nuclease subunit A